MVRRKRAAPSGEFVRLLRFVPAEWPGVCDGVRFAAWNVERLRVLEGLRGSDSGGVSLAIIRGGREARHMVMGHECDGCRK